MKLHVVIINDYGTPVGGASTVALGQARGLAERGNQVTFISAVRADTAGIDGPVRHVSFNQPDLLSNASRAEAALQGLWNFKAARMLSTLLDSYDPMHTVLHLHSWTKALSSSIVPVIRKSRIPAVCTLHDYFAACPNGGFFNYQTHQPCKLRPLSGACVRTHCDSRHYGHKLWRVARQRIQQDIGHMPDGLRHFICVSEYARRHIEPYLPAGSDIRVIPSAIDTERLAPLPAALREGIVFVGRMAPEKGVETYIEACELIDVVPQFLGDGELASWVRQVCPQAQISGWLPPDRLREKLRHAIALAFPTYAYEAQPLSILEAASLGVPAIVTEHCAGASFVNNGQNGLLIQAGNAAALAHAMKWFFDNRTAAVEMGSAAHAAFWSSNIYRPEHCLNALESLYMSMLGETNTIGPR